MANGIVQYSEEIINDSKVSQKTTFSSKKMQEMIENAESSATIKEYNQNIEYKKDTLIYLDEKMARANSDFTSNSTESTLEDSFNSDVTNGYLKLVTAEEQEVPIPLGSIKTDNASDFPTIDVVKGNWVLIEDCVNVAPNQAGIGIYNGKTWDVLPIPSGTFTFPEPTDDGKMYFRKRDTGNNDGAWSVFNSVDGNEIEIRLNIKDSSNSVQGAYVPKSQELVYDSNRNILVIGNGKDTITQLRAFYEDSLTDSDVTGALGFTPENSASKGQVNGYAPLDANGLVPTANLPAALTNVYSKTETDQKDTDTLNSATVLVNTESARATGIETGLRTDLDTHINDGSLHVTQTEKDSWNAKVETSDLVNYDNHLSDTVTHVTQADKDKWNGMSTGYYVTDINDLPTTDVNVGSMGYVQTSAIGVTPVVCDQYIYDGTSWKPYDAGQISLQFNWGNIQNKPNSTVLSIDNAIAIAHNHSNKIALDKIGQSAAGNFTYDGIEIGAKVVFENVDALLPLQGEENTLYVVFEDSRVRNYPSISVWRDGAYQILGRGTQDAPPVVGDMSILQAEYFSVVAGSHFLLTVNPNQYFAFMPLEILKEVEGLKEQESLVTDFKTSSDFKYDEDLISISESNKVRIDIKKIPTNLDTVGDKYYSSIDVDLSKFKDIDCIE